MNRILILLAVLLLSAPLLSFLLGEPEEAAVEPIRPPEELFRPAPLPVVEPAAVAFTRPGEDALFRDAASTAWRYVESQYQPATGLVNSVIGYGYATIWDVGSTLAAYHSAHELGLIGREDFDRRMGAALRTLGSLRLFDGAAFNKNYQVARGLPAGRNDREPVPSSEGYGWSATDLGRLLVWLRIVAEAHPQHAGAARAVAERLDFDRLVKDGYLWGAMRSRNGGIWSYQEGRIGYEQYAAAGFALWERYADRALQLPLHAQRIEVEGIPLFTDARGDAFLTSEPFFLLGIELGWWRPLWEEVALQVLAAQKSRFDRTGQLTMVSEDAVPVAPDYFYYYTLEHGGTEFAVATLTGGATARGPRWLSAKAAFAWYVLFPGPYTWRTLGAVAPAARGGPGWGSGVYEGSGRPTGAQNINTAAVVLEAALYHRRRAPLLAAAAVPERAARDSTD